MTDAEMAEAVRLAGRVDEGDRTGTRHTMPGGYVATIARALLESRRQVEALTKERDGAQVFCERSRGGTEHSSTIDGLAACVWCQLGMARGNLELTTAERDAATARAERAERERDDAIRTAVDHQRINNSLTVKLDEYLTGRKVTSMLATERARVVEAIAADATKKATDHRCGNPGSEWNQHAADALYEYADHIRSHNWAPPEEDGDE